MKRLVVLTISLCFVLSGCIQSDTSLEYLEIPITSGVEADMQPKFSPYVSNYILTVPNDINQIEVIAKASAKEAQVTVNGIDVNAAKRAGDESRKGAVEVDLNEGNNKVKIKVRTRFDTKEYTVSIYRQNLEQLRNQFLDLSYTSEKTGITMPYRLYIPQSYQVNSEQQYPLILYLHANDESGDDNESQLKANMGATIWATDDVQNRQEMFVLAPQASPQGENNGFALIPHHSKISLQTASKLNANTETAKEIIDQLVIKYNIDEERIYGTGVAEGGYGIWNLATKYPNLFAAIVPVSSGEIAAFNNIPAVIDLPTWTFHAKADPVIPIVNERPFAKVLNLLGADIKYTEYPQNTYIYPSAHYAWIPAYHNEEMIKWLISQHR